MTCRCNIDYENTNGIVHKRIFEFDEKEAFTSSTISGLFEFSKVLLLFYSLAQTILQNMLP